MTLIRTIAYCITQDPQPVPWGIADAQGPADTWDADSERYGLSQLIPSTGRNGYGMSAFNKLRFGIYDYDDSVVAGACR